MSLPVVLCYGFGCDSTAILRRWLEDPSSRDFDLEELIVLSAQTGNEWFESKVQVEKYMYPRLAEARIRTVQVGKAGESDRDGIVTFSDTRSPRYMYASGGWSILDHYLSVGQVPSKANNRRRCSVKFKQRPCDKWLKAEFGDRPVRIVIGYNADEVRRSKKSEPYSTDKKRLWFPLIEWGWGRVKTERYASGLTGGKEKWLRSACVICPFSDIAGKKKEALARHLQSPEESAAALFLEFVSLSFNTKQSLYASKSLRECLKGKEPLEHFERMLAESRWAVYEVQRVRRNTEMPNRYVRPLHFGNRDYCNRILDLYAMASGFGKVFEAYNNRVWFEDRSELSYDGLWQIQHYLVAAPDCVSIRKHNLFDGRWERFHRNKSEFDVEGCLSNCESNEEA